MNYFELSCIPALPEHSEILVVQLAELGFESFVDTDAGFKGYIQEPLYNKGVEDQIRDLQADYPFKHTLQLIKDQNWNHEWEKNFSPINVDDKCYVRASFHEPIPGIQYDVVINPKMSFGTGHHETTCLVISQLMKLDLKGRSICDMGCGTSILAILAAKMGAASVLAIDIDDWAVENSVENIDTNNVKGIVVKKGGAQLLAGNTFHVILANINRNILLSDMDKYVESLDEQGVLIMSGFFDVDIPMIQSKAESLGMIIANTELKNKWAMLYCIKNN
jgi:ribosomal protein L11 methyltransferase